MRAGQRPTPIQILVADVTRDPVYDNEVIVWQVLKQVWASTEFKPGREEYAEGSFVALNKLRFDIDWMDGQGITTEHRIRLNGQDYNIKTVDQDIDLKRRVLIEAEAGISETQR